MQKMTKRLFAAAGALAILGFVMPSPEVEARPQYLKAFGATYPDLAGAAKMKKCGICHPKDKKMRLDYGKAVGAGLEKKNEKDPKKLEAAIKGAEGKESSGGGTFGDMIKDGKLPE